MPTTHLKNIIIRELKDKKQNTYYLIVNQNEDNEVYFCFSWSVKENWTDLTNNWKNLKEVELEYELSNQGNRKVINLWKVFTNF